MAKLFKNKRVLLVLAVVLLLIFLNIFWQGFLGNVFSKITSPIQAGFNAVSQKVYNFFSAVFALPRLSQENKNLKEENSRLREQIIELQEVTRENEFLRAQLNLEAEKEMELLMARVSGKDPQNLAQLILINKGLKDYVSVGMPVVDWRGALVGKITTVFSNTAKVLLATDPNSSINGILQESRATGIVKGKYGLGMLMEMIPQNEEVKIGDVVLTSGLGGEFPQGIFIGEVNKIIESEAEIFKKAWIKPAAAFSQLEQVFIILEY